MEIRDFSHQLKNAQDSQHAEQSIQQPQQLIHVQPEEIEILQTSEESLLSQINRYRNEKLEVENKEDMEKTEEPKKENRKRALLDPTTLPWLPQRQYYTNFIKSSQPNDPTLALTHTTAQVYLNKNGHPNINKKLTHSYASSDDRAHSKEIDNIEIVHSETVTVPTREIQWKDSNLVQTKYIEPEGLSLPTFKYADTYLRTRSTQGKG